VVCFCLASACQKEEIVDVEKGTRLDVLQRELRAETRDRMEMALLLNAWVYGSIGANGAARNDPFAEETLRVLHGACGHRSLLVRSVFEGNDAQVRRVSFFDIPVQVGHAAPELFIDGAWRFFDPTFGLFFSTEEAPSVPLSIDEARARYPHIQIMRADVEAWQQERLSMSDLLTSLNAGSLYTVIPLNEATNTLHPEVPVDVVQTYFSSKMARYEKTDHFQQPIFVDLSRSEKGNLGTVDKSFADLSSAFHETSYGSFYHPFLSFIGTYQPGAGPNVSHRFSFLADEPRKVTLTITFVEEMPPEMRDYFVSQIDHAGAVYSFDETRIGLSWSDRALQLEALVFPPASQIELALPQGVAVRNKFHIDAIHWVSAGDGR
jgi:hypothetical protein